MAATSRGGKQRTTQQSSTLVYPGHDRKLNETEPHHQKRNEAVSKNVEAPDSTSVVLLVVGEPRNGNTWAAKEGRPEGGESGREGSGWVPEASGQAFSCCRINYRCTFLGLVRATRSMSFSCPIQELTRRHFSGGSTFTFRGRLRSILGEKPPPCRHHTGSKPVTKSTKLGVDDTRCAGTSYKVST